MPVKYTRVSACGLIFHEDRILLCRLSPMVVGSVGSWILPGGGIDFGEEPREALVREIFEETGLRAECGSLLDVVSNVLHFPAEENEGFVAHQGEDRTVHALRIIYAAKITPGEIVLEQGGTTDLAAWFSREEAEKLPLVQVSKRALELWQ